jgi:RNA polymerase sigma-70 factor, ECF subfamily
MEVRIIEAAALGDRDALAAVVDEFMPTVLGAAYGLCGDLQQAGDIAQEVFATMTARIGDVREPAALPGWLMAVTRSTARRQRDRDPAVPAPAPTAPGPEEVVVARDEARRVRLAVEALPAEQRLPMVLHYFAGHRLAQIAELCGLPLSTIKKRMRVARARLRKELNTMDHDIAAGLRPDAREDPSPTIRLYTAMRSGDAERVAALLDERPDLVDAREDWTRADSFAHRLPVTRGGGTPLLRAVERGDVQMARLLLTRGADPDAACSCAGGESSLWVAAAQHESELVALLLDHGADPDTRAFAGTAAVDVARARRFDDVVRMFARAKERGAKPRAEPVVGPASVAWTEEASSSEASTKRPGKATGKPARRRGGGTGIKAVDLWCPLPAQGLAHVTPDVMVGAHSLVAELSHRAARGGRRVVWTGFVPAPTDLGDVHHGLADTALTDLVQVSLAPPTRPLDIQIAAFDAGIGLAGDDAQLVVFAETGRLHVVEERLLALSARPAPTLVIAPLDGSVTPPTPAGSPYLASIVFDTDRARRRHWPAISPSSWSRVADPDVAALADRARARPTDALDDYLDQPFFVTEHVTGRSGEWVEHDELVAGVAACLYDG